MSHPVNLSQESIDAIATAVAEKHADHVCQFDEGTSKRVQAFADALDDEGMRNFKEVLAFGGTLRTAKGAALKTGVGIFIASIIGILYAGIKMRLRQ